MMRCPDCERHNRHLCNTCGGDGEVESDEAHVFKMTFRGPFAAFLRYWETALRARYAHHFYKKDVHAA
jgi:hypothetical protein